MRISDLDLTGIDWLIVGGESGPGARPMCREWVTDLRDQCLASAVPFFLGRDGIGNLLLTRLELPIQGACLSSAQANPAPVATRE